ncbi:conserved hypothetical protein [uncultured Pleomorphomonas sp.]|uniref:NlpC/P60 domain-containing protein n=2 Tax=uncultured Pleomorphomonas sp. TaxID=442121 RepID=A0A212L2A0_9HYPH|nr:C40 family peptidase [uncultured Pleomorphomonas sp.]SCM71479.1 conserved hypothetical protein [uncultured Pleomorphomonas sp.]
MFSLSVHDAFRAHAIACFPAEACGLVVRRADGDVFVPCVNISTSPIWEFEIALEDYLAAEASGEVVALLHSHVPTDAFPATGMPHPSKTDMQLQVDLGIACGLSLASADSCSTPIYWGDQTPMRDLIGRPYVYGIWDCYSLVRDYYRSRAVRPVTLPVYPRDDDWWDNGEDLYTKFFAEAGFRQIPADQVRAGDAVVMRVRTRVPNHAGVVLENGLLLHHLYRELSKREPIGRWSQLATYWLRHEVDL